MNCLDFWKKPHSRKVTMINSIFSWSLHPWQEWERVVMLSLVRVGTLEKDWLGADLPGNASFPPLTRHILKPLTLSGPTLTWHTGTCLPPQSISLPLPSLSLQNQIPLSLPPGNFQAINFTLSPLFLHSGLDNKTTLIAHILYGRPDSKCLSNVYSLHLLNNLMRG